MPVSDWALLPPHISTVNRGFIDLPSSDITPEIHIKLETTNPDSEIFFSTDGSVPDPLSSNVLTATRTYRYKQPFKLKPGTRTVQAVSVSKSTGAKSDTSSQTFNVVEKDTLASKQYSTDTQIYSNSQHVGGNTYRVEDMNHRNQLRSAYDERDYRLGTLPATAQHDRALSSSVDPEVSNFFSTHNTHSRIASLPNNVHNPQHRQNGLYDDVRASAPYLRNDPTVTSQGRRLTQSSGFDNHRRPLSPAYEGQRRPLSPAYEGQRRPQSPTFNGHRQPLSPAFENHRRPHSPIEPGRKSPVYEMRRDAYLESQTAVHHDARKEQVINDTLQGEGRVADLETEEERLLAELERKYEAEKCRNAVDSDVSSCYSDLLGAETSRRLQDTRVRFEEQSEHARARLEEDRRRRDALAHSTGNKLRYSTEPIEPRPYMSDQRSLRSQSPHQRMHAPRDSNDPDRLEHLLSERDSARDRRDVETLSELESEIEAYRRSVAEKQQTRRSRSRSPQRRLQVSPPRSPESSELDDLFTGSENGSSRYDGEDIGGRLIRDMKALKGVKGMKEKSESEKMEKKGKKDKKEEKKKDKKKKKSHKKSSDSDSDSSSSSDSDASSSSSSNTSVWSKSGGKMDKKNDKAEKKDKKPEKLYKELKEKKTKEKEPEKLKPVSKLSPKTPKSGKPKAPVTPKTPVSTARTDSSRTDTSRTDTTLTDISRLDTSRSVTSKASSVQTPVRKVMKPKSGSQQVVQKQTRKDPVPADSALNFMNDSGTQINFWGAPPKEVIDSMKGMFPSVKPVANQNGAQKSTQKVKAMERTGPKVEELAEDSDSDNQSELNDWFSPTRGVNRGANRPPTQKQPQKSGQLYSLKSSATTKPARISLSQTSPAKLNSSAISPRTPSPSGSSNPVSAAKQTEQESVGGFFKKLFKGWGSSEKSEKSKETRQTVRVAGDDSGVTYQQLKAKVEKRGDLFEDPDFSCEDSSLYFSQKPVSGEVEWKRPHEICSEPEMFVGGASRFDIKQGVLGNCWLLAAMASLTTDQKLLYKVVPSDQSFSKGYAGIFRFRLWQYGRWVEVCIDDRLPTQKGKLIYMHSTDTNEFWSPLLEKAYAKLVGCYENLTGGLQSEAMTDFTGGVCERYNFREELPDNMFQILNKARQRGALMGCSIDAGTFKAKALPGKTEEELENGLIIGHAYSLTDVKQLESSRGVVQLVRCRNPWGTEHEWNGAWSDQSSEWQNISEENKKQLGLKFEHDGEFWMDFRDFSANFQRVEICNLGPDDLMDDSDDDVKWKCQTLQGCWKKKVNAGGCRNFPKSFHTNPQYRVELIDADEDDDEDVCTLIVALMQKGRRLLKQSGKGNLTIGYEIYDVGDEGSGTLDRDFFRDNNPVASAPQYINMREIVGRHRLPPSQYCIVPTTFEPDEEADLVIRAFTEGEAGEVIESDEPTCFVQPKTSALVQSAAHVALDSEADTQFEAHGGEDGEIDATELKEILDTVFTTAFKCGSFAMPLCRSLVTSRDLDGQGKLSLEEFRMLWSDLTRWKDTFKQSDKDNSGKLFHTELREALKASGLSLSNATLKKVVPQYTDKEGNVDFDDFVACVLKLTEILRHFESKQSKTGDAQFNIDEIVQMNLS